MTIEIFYYWLQGTLENGAANGHLPIFCVNPRCVKAHWDMANAYQKHYRFTPREIPFSIALEKALEKHSIESWNEVASCLNNVFVHVIDAKDDAVTAANMNKIHNSYLDNNPLSGDDVRPRC